MDFHGFGNAFVVVSELVQPRGPETPGRQDSCWWGKRGRVNHAWAKKGCGCKTGGQGFIQETRTDLYSGIMCT